MKSLSQYLCEVLVLEGSISGLKNVLKSCNGRQTRDELESKFKDACTKAGGSLVDPGIGYMDRRKLQDDVRNGNKIIIAMQEGNNGYDLTIFGPSMNLRLNGYNINYGFPKTTDWIHPKDDVCFEFPMNVGKGIIDFAEKNLVKKTK